MLSKAQPNRRATQEFIAQVNVRSLKKIEGPPAVWQMGREALQPRSNVEPARMDVWHRFGSSSFEVARDIVG